jgi:2-polyprenyl-3-methyl-5-hydroxy-6-metoxy-1,4-benzoquinol methylase
MRDLETYSSDYESIPFERHQEKFRRKAVNEILSGRVFDRALEIGCGLNSSLADLDFGQGDVIEPLDLCIKQASSKLNSDQLARIVFHKGLAEKLLPNSSELANYDIVLALSIVHEVQDPKALMVALKDSLSSNGMIAITVTHSNSIHRVLGRELGMQINGTRSAMEVKMQQTTGAMSIEEMHALLESTGLKAHTISTFFPKILPHSSLQNLYDRGVIDDHYLDQMYELGDELAKFGSEIICLATKA